MKAVGRGRAGNGLVIECSGGLTLTLLLGDKVPGSQARVVQSLAGESASDCLAAIELIESVAKAASLQVMRGATPLLTLRAQVGVTLTPVTPEYERQLVEDLAVISKFALLPFDVPVHLTAHERQEIRRLRLILDGRAVIEPAFGQLSTALAPDTPDHIVEMLTGMFAVAITARVGYNVLGHEITLKDAVIYHGHASVKDRDAIRARFDAAREVGEALDVVLSGGEHGSFWVYVPERTSDGERARLSALDIPGMDEPALPTYGDVVIDEA